MRRKLGKSDLVPLSRVKRGQVFMEIKDCWGAPRSIVLVASGVKALRSKMEYRGWNNLCLADEDQAFRKTSDGVRSFSLEDNFCHHCGEPI